MAHHNAKTRRETRRCTCGRSMRAREARGAEFAGLTGCVHRGH